MSEEWKKCAELLSREQDNHHTIGGSWYGMSIVQLLQIEGED